MNMMIVLYIGRKPIVDDIYVYICWLCWAWTLKHMIDENFMLVSTLKHMIDEMFCVEREALEHMSTYICIQNKYLELMKI